jgi:hypothetical protein
MGRYMVELGLTPAARSRVMTGNPIATRYLVSPEPLQIERVIADGDGFHRPVHAPIRTDYVPMTAEQWEANHCGGCDT